MQSIVGWSGGIRWRTILDGQSCTFAKSSWVRSWSAIPNLEYGQKTFWIRWTSKNWFYVASNCYGGFQVSFNYTGHQTKILCKENSLQRKFFAKKRMQRIGSTLPPIVMAAFKYFLKKYFNRVKNTVAQNFAFCVRQNLGCKIGFRKRPSAKSNFWKKLRIKKGKKWKEVDFSNCLEVNFEPKWKFSQTLMLENALKSLGGHFYRIWRKF